MKIDWEYMIFNNTYYRRTMFKSGYAWEISAGEDWLALYSYINESLDLEEQYQKIKLNEKRIKKLERIQ